MLEKEVEAKIKAIYKEKGVPRPVYTDLPAGNDGLGLYFGCYRRSPADVYNEIKEHYLKFVERFKLIF
jgi:methylmalonyl-CoA mutase